MQSIELDFQTIRGSVMVFMKQKQIPHICNLHGVEVFLDLEAFKSCERFNAEEEQ
jgi:hypothetical protein